MFSQFGPYRYWFFDLDGTLADTDADIRLAWKAAMKDLGLECAHFDRDFIAGPPIDVMVAKLFPDSCTPELIARLRAGFGAHYDGDGFPNTREYPRVMAGVRALKERGATLAIVTNKRYVGAQAMAHHFGWDEIFDGLFAGDMYKDDPMVGKLLKPQLLGRVMKQYGARPDECILVGDTANDFDAATENGIDSLAVSWGYGTLDECKRAKYMI